jgi:hypothetical protein
MKKSQLNPEPYKVIGGASAEEKVKKAPSRVKSNTKQSPRTKRLKASAKKVRG